MLGHFSPSEIGYRKAMGLLEALAIDPVIDHNDRSILEAHIAAIKRRVTALRVKMTQASRLGSRISPGDSSLPPASARPAGEPS